MTIPATSRMPRADGGFTLMEVALAILVAAIGLMAVFGLIGHGLEASLLAIGDTQAAIFADNVFNTLRAESLRAAELGAVEWEDYWLGIDGQKPIVVATEALWAQKIEVKSLRQAETLVFANRSVRTGDVASDPIVNHALQYRMDVEPDDRSAPMRYMVSLYVWPTQFGPTEDKDALLFYAEFNNPGDL